MGIAFREVGPGIGAEVSGIDLTQPLGNADAETIHAGMDRYAVLVFRGQPLSDDEHQAFSRALGPLEQSLAVALRKPEEHRLPTSFADVSNLDKEDRPFARDDRRRLFSIGNQLWHSDSSFKPVPAKYSILRALSVPSKGGNTEFAHMGLAYDALDATTKAEIEDLICEHSQIFSRQQIGFFEFTEEERNAMRPVRQRLVRIHPSTGRKSLYLSSHAGGIVGWPVPEARMLLRDLAEHATQRQFVYAHRWRVGDVVMWDNRQTMHRGRPYPADEPRDVRRTTLAGEAPTVEQVA